MHSPKMEKQKIKFEYLTSEIISTLAIAGTFNNWNPEKNYFTQTKKGCWEVELDIPVGRHLYKFVIDETDWILDPLNPSISEDNQNNSSITVLDNGEKYIRDNRTNENNPNYVYSKYSSIKNPEWLEQAIIYQLHAGAFSNNGFKGVIEKIPYLKELGINTIWLMPFQEVGLEKRIGSNGDPYAVKDFYSIDSKYDTKEELLKLIKLLHHNNFNIIMDLPLNRASVDANLTQTNKEYFTLLNDKIYYEVPNRDYFAGFNFENEELRTYLIDCLKYWITEFDFDGFRFDDSDLAPLDFLGEIRKQLDAVKRDIVLISQSYDEYHHIQSCNLTYDGSLFIQTKRIANNEITSDDFIEIYDSYKYSFPKNALRMRWIEEKEQPRAKKYFGDKLVYPATSLLLLFDGIPHVMMGQEFNESDYNTWTTLFNEFVLNWEEFDEKMFNHFKFLISIRLVNNAFTVGTLKLVRNSENTIITFLRKYLQEEYLVILNLSNQRRTNLVVHLEEKTITTHIPIDPYETQIADISGDEILVKWSLKC